MKAIWKSIVLAESDDTIIIENNHYFPPSAVRKEFFEESTTHTFCPWKGSASYLSVKIGDDFGKDVAWYYADPFDEAIEIKDFIAFWRDVEVIP